MGKFEWESSSSSSKKSVVAGSICASTLGTNHRTITDSRLVQEQLNPFFFLIFFHEARTALEAHHRKGSKRDEFFLKERKMN